MIAYTADNIVFHMKIFNRGITYGVVKTSVSSSGAIGVLVVCLGWYCYCGHGRRWVISLWRMSPIFWDVTVIVCHMKYYLFMDFLLIRYLKIICRVKIGIKLVGSMIVAACSAGGSLPRVFPGLPLPFFQQPTDKRNENLFSWTKRRGGRLSALAFGIYYIGILITDV